MIKTLWKSTPFLSVFTLFPALLQAQELPEVATINTGDTAWMIVACALVLFMTLPGLALFYGGLVRAKNVLSVLMHCMAMAGLMSILWMVFGYSLAFSEGAGGLNKFIGGLDFTFLRHMDVNTVNGSIPEPVFIMFQMTFIIITPALIVGAFAERMKFSAMLLFLTFWTIFSYLPICHMAWGGGLFADWGVLDFAGGTVVHINAGIAGLVSCIMLGKRTGYPNDPIKPHNLPLAVVGGSMLWVGWFGFNGGSQLAADGVAGMAVLVTHLATAMAALTWMFIEWFRHGKPSVLGVITGAVAGLVAITPASGTAGPAGALLIGFCSSAVCFYFATRVKKKLGYDDSLDVFGVHGVGGIIGAILTGLCAASFMGGIGLDDGVSVGAQVWSQTLSVLVTIVWSGVVSFVVLKVVDLTVGLRVSEDIEVAGLDLRLHDEQGYEI
ncbi:ammonium transporter [Puniceicoccales bacterium CK1056]|uniref:Ammonium transporter n=1 Tax=Oceanipulchritudo coccoides TaxID=2706888 RepID=A0A6B2LY14_9BACT|nr:ammonium transporter [Oceanipulchritudo coccoides]NDV60929.1 ammonium transporter [Oceanipulchritudo coccoides]